MHACQHSFVDVLFDSWGFKLLCFLENFRLFISLNVHQFFLDHVSIFLVCALLWNVCACFLLHFLFFFLLGLYAVVECFLLH